MPVERRKKTKTPEDVPDLGDPDRKRVLNVLAQRRYRQKRREKIAHLEAQTKGLDQSTTASLNQSIEDSDIQLDNIDLPHQISESQTYNDASLDVEEILRDTPDMSFLEPDLNFTQDLDFSVLLIPTMPTLLSSDSSSTSSSSPPLHFPLTPDGAFLDVPIISAMRAFGTIALALDVASHIWTPSYLHTLPPTPNLALPPNLHPTPAQSTIPHHPLFDILPWPSVREKLICMFAIPSGCRPLVARQDDGEGQSKAVVQLMMDLDESGGECRVHGNVVGWGQSNELIEEAWEVGEGFFKNWWWCMDRRIVELSNQRRKERGLPALKV
ncbi:hypothetical protein B0J11DRAFT_153731 [Dendryphion nanum]|uniref:BZIP domain-containing protein n=1 Tax=Dendryphion nanum TaxID=256645 RepID=A0A9P9EB58_9PLEO|nr:hypothetical protein B0J11DRAFT_153731 [Dendryphion nanum]